MRPLVWKKIKSEKRDKTGGFLVMLLTVLASYMMVSVTRNVSRPCCDSPCDNPVLIQVDGDVRVPGIYKFCQQPDLQTLLKRVSRPGAVPCPPNSMMHKTVPSGFKILIQNDGIGYTFSIMEMSAFSKMTLGLPISLNRENEEGLTALPGIGPALARAIVLERDERGGFRDLDDLKDVEGVGDRLLEKLRPFVIL